jgi:4-aminobutyrate aminotransferase-like enzyme
MKAGLEGIAAQRSDIGDVRGAGLFLAVECVADTEANAPDAALARFVVNHLRRNGVLISATGPGANILKIRPPLILNDSEADYFLNAVEAAFAAT